MNTPLIIGISIIVVIVVFLILRELFTWYWKINRIVELLERQNELLHQIAGVERVSEIIETQSNEPSFVKGEVIITKQGQYINYPDATGTAFCLGCRTTDSWKHLYYNSASDTYYHKDCIPQDIKL